MLMSISIEIGMLGAWKLLQSNFGRDSDDLFAWSSTLEGCSLCGWI